MGRSTIDHILVIRQIIEKYYVYARDLHMIFVDYKQAYDSIIRKELWRTLAYLGISKKLIILIQMCNTDTYSRIKLKNISSHTFKIENGLRQGDAMSPVLFNLALERVIRKVPRTKDLTLKDGNIILACADDIVIIEKTQEEVKKSNDRNDKSRGKYRTKN